jgi:hypothetical protein
VDDLAGRHRLEGAGFEISIACPMKAWATLPSSPIPCLGMMSKNL